MTTTTNHNKKQDFFGAIGDQFKKVGDAVGGEFSKIGDRTIKNINADGDEIANGVKKNGLLGGVCSTVDVFSPGHLTAEVLDDGGVVTDPAMKQMIAGGVNMLAGAALPGVGLIWQLDAIAEFGDGIGKMASPKAGAPANGAPQAGAPAAGGSSSGSTSSTTTQAECAPSQGNERPSVSRYEEFKAAKQAAVRHQAIEEAKEKSAAKRAGYELGFQDGARGAGSRFDGGPNGGYADGGFNICITINNDYGAMIEKLHKTHGPDNIDKANSALDRILNDPSLSFEDKIFELMQALTTSDQKDITKMEGDLVKSEDASKASRNVFDKQLDGLRGQLETELAKGKNADPSKINSLNLQVNTLTEKRNEKASDESDSRQKLAEQLKNATEKLSEMQQALSGVLNSMHENSMNAIRNIK